MSAYEPLLPQVRSCQLHGLWGALLVGLMLGSVGAQIAPVADERSPQIVRDAPAPIAAPATPIPAAGLAGVVEETKKAIPGESVLLDPTEPMEELRAAIIPGERQTGNLFLPGSADHAGGNAPLAVLASGAERSPRPPITGSAPFAPEATTGDGPVVMGTDLQPDAAATALAPEQTPPELLDAPLVESADPWVFRVEQISLYEDNIELSSRGQQADFVFMLRASVAWQRGDLKRKRGSWARVFYEATGTVFAEADHENSLDHDFQAGGQRRWGRLAAALEGRYRFLSGATPDLGDRVERQEYGARLGASYDLSGRTFLEAGARWTGVDYQDKFYADYDEWAAEGFAGYELSGRTRIAAGAAVGQLKVEGTAPQDFQQALVKVTRASTGALGLTGRAGAEFRQMERGDEVTPVFAVAADWEPIADGTRVSAEGFRETVASGALGGETYLRTGGALRILQQLGSRFAAGLETGYEQLVYSEISDGAAGRTDDYFFTRPSLKYEFNARRRAEVFYNFREDDSTSDEFSFTANQWGLSFGLDF